MTARDQHDARFAMAADWPDLDDEGRHLVFQRLNLYAIVASYGWSTAIASICSFFWELKKVYVQFPFSLIWTQKSTIIVSAVLSCLFHQNKLIYFKYIIWIPSSAGE